MISLISIPIHKNGTVVLVFLALMALGLSTYLFIGPAIGLSPLFLAGTGDKKMWIENYIPYEIVIVVMIVLGFGLVLSRANRIYLLGQNSSNK